MFLPKVSFHIILSLPPYFSPKHLWTYVSGERIVEEPVIGFGSTYINETIVSFKCFFELETVALP